MTTYSKAGNNSASETVHTGVGKISDLKEDTRTSVLLVSKTSYKPGAGPAKMNPGITVETEVSA